MTLGKKLDKYRKALAEEKRIKDEAKLSKDPVKRELEKKLIDVAEKAKKEGVE